MPASDAIAMTDSARSAVSVIAARPDMEGLYRNHWREVCGFIHKTFGSGPPDPEDAAQAAFEQFVALSDSGRVDNPRAFLFRSARNFIVDYHRRSGVERRNVGLVADALWPVNAADDLQRSLEGQQRLVAVAEAIRTLDARRRTVLISRSLHDLSFAEIARRMNLSRTRVLQLFAEAIAHCEGHAASAESPQPRPRR